MLKLRCVASQLCATFPYNCLQFTLGNAIGFTIILIAEVSKKDSEIPMTLDQLSWFASLSILKIFGSLITGMTMHHLGNRLTTLLAALIFISSYLLYYYSTTPMTILISGIVSMIPVVNALSTPYTSEISEPRLRATLVAITSLAASFGGFFTLLMASLVYWRTIALVSLIFPIVTVITVLMTPNSPTWLASRGRMDEAEAALCWVRGWVCAIDVQTEFHALVASVEQHKYNNDNNNTNHHHQSLRERVRNFVRPFVDRTFYRPFGTIVLLIILYEFSGLFTMIKYATLIFRKIQSPIDESIATAIMGAADIAGNIFVLLSIRRVGKRGLSCFFSVVAAICLIVVALISYFSNQSNYYSWISTIAMIVVYFARASGIGTIIMIVSSEIFPRSVRYIGTAMSFSIYQIVSGVTSKSFLYVVEAMTLHGTILVFAIVNVVASIVYYFLLPETEGKSLQEIEDHFKGIRVVNVRDSEKKNERLHVN